ncbi:hypothetical protein [Pseudorhodobacter sp.]|uniref:hypothetical protein n=1 Tax=Pseudorhodobacter sp. TaxID=1934400 RepID=UPI002649B21E|nr:hypothetical protein [Pseudorhodobacter sp.]MDN5789036.1 hypothetical protein [Pseudorhodobacter sp.]
MAKLMLELRCSTRSLRALVAQLDDVFVRGGDTLAPDLRAEILAFADAPGAFFDVLPLTSTDVAALQAVPNLRLKRLIAAAGLT